MSLLERDELSWILCALLPTAEGTSYNVKNGFETLHSVLCSSSVPRLCPEIQSDKEIGPQEVGFPWNASETFNI